jgi:hypothetical protein
MLCLLLLLLLLLFFSFLFFSFLIRFILIFHKLILLSFLQNGFSIKDMVCCEKEDYVDKEFYWDMFLTNIAVSGSMAQNVCLFAAAEHFGCKLHLITGLLGDTTIIYTPKVLKVRNIFFLKYNYL